MIRGRETEIQEPARIVQLGRESQETQGKRKFRGIFVVSTSSFSGVKGIFYLSVCGTDTYAQQLVQRRTHGTRSGQQQFGMPCTAALAPWSSIQWHFKDTKNQESGQGDYARAGG